MILICKSIKEWDPVCLQATARIRAKDGRGGSGKAYRGARTKASRGGAGEEERRDRGRGPEASRRGQEGYGATNDGRDGVAPGQTPRGGKTKRGKTNP